MAALGIVLGALTAAHEQTRLIVVGCKMPEGTSNGS
jgi:hypothetical protein